MTPRRLLDAAIAAIALAACSPILAVAALGIRLSSRGPILYRAQRAGLNGRTFAMLKMRTMHVSSGGSAITATRDPRIFAWGSLLRALKIDELPQLVNILRGDMAIIGPRPEDPAIVARDYWPEHHETLRVLPGLASPGSIFNYTHGDELLADGDPEVAYRERLMPIKLAMDIVYVRRRSLLYDMRIIARTLSVIAARMSGTKEFPLPPEYAEARALVDQRSS